MIGLVLAAVASGLVTAWIVRRTVNMPGLQSTLRRIHAHFLEFRLFFDEPRLIWRAQKDLVRANLHFCALLLRPTLILGLPMIWLMMQLDATYGAAPLHVGEPAVVTAQLATDLRPGDARSILHAPPGVIVETPPVRLTSDRQIAWRIRRVGSGAGNLSFTLRGVTLAKSMTTPRRDRSLFAFLLHPEESRLPPGDVISLRVNHSEQSRWWIAWFLGISTVSAFAVARWLV